MKETWIASSRSLTGQMIGPVFAGSIHDLTQSFAVALIITSVLLIITAATLLGGSSKREVVQPRNSM